MRLSNQQTTLASGSSGSNVQQVPTSRRCLSSRNHPQQQPPMRRGFALLRSSGGLLGSARRAPLPLPNATSSRLPNLSNMGGTIKDLKELELDGDDMALLDPKNLRNVKSMSYVSRRRMDDPTFDADAVDEEGLPLVYNEQRIADYWSKRPADLLARWTRFTAISAPWLTKLANAFLSGKIVERQAALAADAVDNLTQLGPTFVKLGQILSIRPDVLPPPVMKELGRLQDKIKPFSCKEAKAVVEKDLGRPIDEIFSKWSDEPIGAASLAQVYKAELRGSGVEVAVKVQRPNALATISKDLYVLRRAVGVYQQIVNRFTAQTTDYQELLSVFAEGLFTEMDFRNEALNGLRMQELLDESEFSAADIVIPVSYMGLTTRRVHTMEWVTGVKLTTLEPQEVRSLVKVGQEAFLTQLLEIGYFHGDPHPGNLLKITEGPNAGKLALIDFGLVAEIPRKDREAMVSATIHLANRDWDALVDDFIALGFLPTNCNRAQIVPVMDRVLSPYLRGGGAAAFNFSALSNDLLAATLEIPFSVPPYMSLIARSVVTLEGIALTGDPQYQMVAQAYPFVVRKVLRNDSNGSMSLLQDILFDNDGKVKPTRLGALLNAGLGYVADAKQSAGFIDFDAVPDDGASVSEVVAFLLSPEARELRPLLVREISNGLDLFLRDRFRKAYALLPSLLTPPRLLPFLPALPPAPTPPLFVPGLGLVNAEEAVEMLAPPLNSTEQVYLVSLMELTANLLGVTPAELESPTLLNLPAMIQMASNPSEPVQEIGDALSTMSGDRANIEVVQAIVLDVVETLANKQQERTGVPASQLFGPGLDFARQAVSSIGSQLGDGVSRSGSSRRGRVPAQSSSSDSTQEDGHLNSEAKGSSSKKVDWDHVPAGSVSRLPSVEPERVPVAV